MTKYFYKYFLKIYLICIAIFSVACSKDNTVIQANAKQEAVLSPVSLRLTVAPRIAKGIKGDFTRNVSFSIQERPWHKFVTGKLDCTMQPDAHLRCQTTDHLTRLSEGKTYRIIIFSQKDNSNDKSNDEVACDYFIYDKSQIPHLDITPTSSGECLIWQLQNDTGFSEEEIRTRVRHILNDGEIPDDYDLPLTLYNLYKSYDNEYDWQQALYEVTDLIKEDKPLTPARKSQIGASGRVF